MRVRVRVDVEVGDKIRVEGRRKARDCTGSMTAALASRLLTHTLHRRLGAQLAQVRSGVAVSVVAQLPQVDLKHKEGGASVGYVRCYVRCYVVLRRIRRLRRLRTSAERRILRVLIWRIS